MKKSEMTQINKLRNKKGEAMTDFTEMQKFIRDNYEQPYANEINNLEEMNKFLESYSFPRPNHEEIQTMSRQITSIKVETMSKKLPTNKIPGVDGLIGKFYHTYREKLAPILQKLFQNVTEAEQLPNSCYEVTITLI